MNKPRAYHPLVLGFYLPLALYAHGINIIPFETTLSGFAVSMGFAAAVFGVFWLIFRDSGKAAMIATALIVFAFFYGHLNNLLAGTLFADQLTIAGQLPRQIQSYSLRVWGIGFGLLIIWLCWRKATYRTATRVLNLVSLALLVVPAAGIALHFATASGGGPAVIEPATEQIAATGPDGRALRVKGRPRDIYFLIFDRYGSLGGLADLYGFDNTPFVEALRARGFYVATESVANYFGSHHSLASTLNMTYLDHLTEKIGRESKNRKPLNKMIQDHQVQRLLKAAGYRYYHLGSTWVATRRNRHADVNFSGKAPNEFLAVLMQTNAIPRIASKWGLNIRWIESKCFRINAKMDLLKQIPRRRDATFTFAHFLLPHEPYVFDADGRCMGEKEAQSRDWRTNFLAQLAYTNSRILELVDTLIEDSEVPPVIILQGDEGPYPLRVVEMAGRGGEFDWRNEATGAEWRQKMGIFNALYLPNVDAGLLSPGMTPVNTFRIVFNTYFNGSFEILPDKSFRHAAEDRVYDFYEITDKIK